MDISSLIINIPANVYWLDSNNIYQGCSQQQAIFLGLQDQKEIIGKQNKELPLFIDYPEIAKRIDDNNLQIIKDGVSKVFEESVIVNDEKIIFFIS